MAGVIEGFYGMPWSPAERRELFGWMAAWGLDTYLYAPKDDLKHRALWREEYTAAEAASLGGLIRDCREHGLRFIYALGPGLDLAYSDPADQRRLETRFGQMLALGARDFALLFDDIPDRMSEADGCEFPSFAAAHCHTANALFQWTRERATEGRFLFCPTPYCGRMAMRELGGAGYLETAGRELAPDIEILWTGPEIISREITVAHVREVAAKLRRKPVIWDNLHANDYDRRRFYCGPYSGRPAELRAEVRGLLSNPNNEFPLNYVPLRTLARFARSPGEWEPRESFLAALAEWLPRFHLPGAELPLEDLVLFADCFYLAHETGPAALAFADTARSLLNRDPAGWGGEITEFRQRLARLRMFCWRVARLEDRALFYALSRGAWDLGEELDLLDRCLATLAAGGRDAVLSSDFHLPGTYRGGFVSALQRLLVQHPDGTFTPGVEGA